MSSVTEESYSGDPRRVYILARKVLLQNTRIFKQASSLTRAGYEVTVIGILPRDAPTHEKREGFTIIRLKLDPLYARVPRRIRRGVRTVNRVIVYLPFRYLRTRLRVRRRGRQLLSAVGWLGDGLGAITRAVRRLVDRDPRRRVRRYRLLRRWQILCFEVGARLSKLFAEPVADDTDQETSWTSVLLLPILLIIRLGRGLGRALASIGRRFSIYRGLRWLVRREEGALRAISELFIKLLTIPLRGVAWPLKSIEYYKQVGRTVGPGRLLPPPDLIHANDLDTLWIASVLARRHAVPLIYDAQELYPGLHTLPKWYRRALSVQERVLIRRAQRTIVVNDAIKDVMERRYKVKIDTVVLNCPPLTEEFAGNGPATVRRLFGLADEELVLLYSGALGPNRGLVNTVRALEHCSDANLVLLGEGPLRDELVELAVRLGVDDRVFFADFVHHLDVPSFISSADIGVIPYENVGLNHYLCSPSKLFHYIMAGLPIACSDFPFLRQVVLGNGIGATFDPSDPLSISGAVRRLGFEPGVYEACKQRLAVVRREYCWEEQEKRFMSVYDSLALPPAPQASSVKSLKTIAERTAVDA